MIYIIAPEPKPAGENEGFHLRVEAIDEIFKGYEKKYYQKDNIKRHLKDLESADLIYVHSILMAKEILPFYEVFKDKIVTDLHGLVPEEARLTGNKLDIEEFTEIEKRVFDSGRYFVAVSENMKQYFIQKYTLPKNIKWSILPIFSLGDKIAADSKRINLSVVYAGGTQPWQNIDLMVEAIDEAPSDYSYTFLTPNVNDVKERTAKSKSSQIQIIKVKKSELIEYYQNSTYGFILRDDNPVNSVACPTKLIEYLENEIIPIVIQPNIGDFNALRYSYILLDDFKAGKIPDAKTIEKMRINNLKVLVKLSIQAKHGTTTIQKWVGSKNGKSLIAGELFDIEYAHIVNLNKKYLERMHKFQYEYDMLENSTKYYKSRAEQLDIQLIDIKDSTRWKLANGLARLNPARLRAKKRV